MEKNLNACTLSGTSTKIAFSAGALFELHSKGRKFDIISGTSGGSICALMYSVSKMVTLSDKVMTYSTKDIFSEDISKRFNKYKSYVRLFRKGYAYRMDGLRNMLYDSVSLDDFNRFRDSESAPICFAHCYDEDNRTPIYHKLNNLEYDEAIEAVIASCSIPLATPSVRLKGRDLYDGGYERHISSVYIARNYGHKLRSLTSIFSRPEDISLFRSDLNQKDTFKRFETIMQVKNMTESHDSHILTRHICKRKKVNYSAIFAPHILQRSLYDANPEQNAEFFSLGMQQANTIL